MNKNIKSCFFLIITLVCLVFIEIFINIMKEIVKSNFDVISLLLFISLMSIVFGFILNVQHFIEQLKCRGTIIWDIPKLSLSILLFVIFVLYTLTCLKIIASTRFITIIMFEYPYSFIFLGILFGHTLTELFTKDSTESM
ncbi:hypothetical protein [Clostridium luticellarii]|uniref:hypothetical protein n=1 Tax=Clostridium luticellarii TaxID=1691940 RepID=UPI002354BCB7|nr:hypothetical protein [Clostridium luticellarii]MCI1943638.1 hypothetical protein [Clostridium luticellarii]MCI1969605.1 hypothetical protein [Clostridium luticellarii]MCI1996581.1 hypothetical protein [Clostridium luticellarii]MCI2038781.1 hypothetical protein [Clostridium luticellarii]